MSDVLPSAVEELEKLLLAWLRARASEGQALLKKETAYTEMEKAIKAVEGRSDPREVKSQALSSVSVNRIKKIVLETTSALTDVRPIWNYDTHNEEFKKQAEILNNLARGWWKNNTVDRRLQSILMFSCTGGSGYGVLSWNKDLPGGGDFELIPMDPRDVIPIDPVYSDSIQDWRGVILRQRMPAATVKQMFPLKAHKVVGTKSSWLPAAKQDGAIVSSIWSLIKGSSDHAQPAESVEVMRVFVKDDRLLKEGGPLVMGDPGSNWAYTVYPLGSTMPDGRIATEAEARLYPRGRLIICTPEAVLRDIPNPYWHGLFPVVRFTLDPLPWTLLGAAMVGDLSPMQVSLNEALRGLDDGVGQWVRRGVIADSRSISQENLKAIDTRKPGLRVPVNPTVGEGFKIVDGPEFPSWYMQFLEFLTSQMDELSGVRGLQQLAQMRAMPSEDVMEKYTDALSPLLRLRSRSIELSLGELAEMLKVGFFQYYDAKRRMQILGKDGTSLEDFDYDPGTLVPTGEGSREERAVKHHRNFTFSIAPNSFLNVSHTTQKMMMLQLLRANLIDPWTAWASFDIANIGKPPAETVPERIIEARRLGLQPGPTPEQLQMQQAMMAAQAQQAIGQVAMMQQVQPPQGQAPNTSGVGPQGGRPPSGGQPPQFVQKDGGTRTVVSESGA